MPVIEFEGKTTEEAIEKACNQLHIPSDELKFEILSAGSSGIFGLGSRKASIRVVVEEKLQAKTPETSPQEQRAPRESREPRETRPRVTERREPSRRPRVESEPRNRRRPERKPPRREEPPRLPDNMPLPPTMAGPGEDVYSGPENEVMSHSREMLEGILQRMGIESTVKVSKIEDRIILAVDGENSGLLIGKKGATLDALQFLLNKIVNRTRNDKNRIIVDTENYRVRRHQSLIDLAHRMAEKAMRNRRPVTISQLSAHDRRVVHLALQDRQGLKTRSRGDGPMKNVIIIPGGKRPRRPSSEEDRSNTGSSDTGHAMVEEL